MLKKFSSVLLLLLIANLSKAQVNFAFFGGPQLTSASYSVNGKKQPTDFKVGMMAGLGLKVPFENQLYFFPSIYYSLKGYKVTFNTPSFPPTQLAKNNNTTIHTITIAPLFQVDFSKKPSHVFIRFGPSLDFAITGREKFDTVSSTGVRGGVNRAMLFSFSDYGRYGAAGNVQIGYETQHKLLLFAWYEHGLVSLNNADGGPRILPRLLGLSAGWYFAQRN